MRIMNSVCSLMCFGRPPSVFLVAQGDRSCPTINDPATGRKVGDVSMVKEIRRGRSAASGGVLDECADSRSIGPTEKARRLTPFSYRRDGTIIQLLDLP